MTKTAKQDANTVPALAPETRAAATRASETQASETQASETRASETRAAAAEGEAQPETAAEPEETVESATEESAKPDLDETKRKFREALDRKHQAHNEGQGQGNRDGSKINGAHGPAASRRNFRRKSG